jgi:magnesium transporter
MKMENNYLVNEEKPWYVLKTLIDDNDFESLKEFTDSLPRDEMIHALFKLSQSDQELLISNLDPAKAAELIEDIPKSYAADVLEHIQPFQAASIVSALQSDERVDILKEIEDDEAEKILEEMQEEEANKVRRLINYPSDVAGGLMMTEFLSYPKHLKTSEVVKDLTDRPDDYALYNVQYLYVVHVAHELLGVIRLRDLVLSDPDTRIEDIAIKAKTVQASTTQEELIEFFDKNEISACPVIDEKNTLLGVIRKTAVDAALSEKAEIDYQKSQGIVNGEELRSMPTSIRSKKRLSWLSVNIVLNVCAASIIAMFEDTLTSVIALAVFLPIVSDMSGCSGNQSIAVSMRELTLGIARPSDMVRVWLKELSVGAINGLALGLLLGMLTFIWKDNVYLGLVVGTALFLNTMIAVSIGGVMPLLLKKFKIDPAVASGPILTTITDMCGFFLVLGFATIMLSKLV